MSAHSPLSTVHSPLIPPGYKQTEVGIIPEEWEVRTIRNVSIMVTVGFVGSMSHLFTANGIPLLRGQNVLPGRIDLADAKFISPQTHDLWKKSALRGGDIVIVRVGYPGTCAVLPRDFGAANAASLVVVRPDPSCVESVFMCCVLLSDIGRRQVKAALVGGAQQVINIGTAASLLLPIPDKPEQRAIATALSDVDALVTGLDGLIAKKRDLKQAAMQQLLTGQTRLPGFKGKWEVKSLGDAGKCLRGVSYKGDSDLSTHDMPHTKRLLRSNNVQNAIVVTDEVQFVDAARVSSHQILQQDDILICMANGSKALVGKAGFFMVVDGHEYTFGTFMGCFRTNSSEANPAFVFYLFLTGRYRDYINNLLAGSSINNLRPSSLESLEFSLPPLPEQTAIAEVLTEMDAELAALEQRREKTRALKPQPHPILPAQRHKRMDKPIRRASNKTLESRFRHLKQHSGSHFLHHHRRAGDSRRAGGFLKPDNGAMDSAVHLQS